MSFAKGERVKHPALPEWGVGEVLKNLGDDKFLVFFVGIGEKTISLKHVSLLKVEGTEAEHPLLDNLISIIQDGDIKYKTPLESIVYFLSNYPNGFYGDKFNNEERTYKVKAGELFTELLNEKEFYTFLNNQDYDEISKRALKVVSATNLIFPNEKMALKDGLGSSQGKEIFSKALFVQLYGQDNMEDRFNGFIEALREINAAKWTTATYFLFLAYPDQYIFLKPEITKNAARVCRFEIHYKSELNWQTYERVLKLASYLRVELKELKPRDMIDIQSFMWTIAPE